MPSLHDKAALPSGSDRTPSPSLSKVSIRCAASIADAWGDSCEMRRPEELSDSGQRAEKRRCAELLHFANRTVCFT